MKQQQIAENLQSIVNHLEQQNKAQQQSFVNAFVGVVTAFNGGTQEAINTSVSQLYATLPGDLHNQQSLEALLLLVSHINLQELPNDTQAATITQALLNRVTLVTGSITQFLIHPKDLESFLKGLGNLASYILNGLDNFPEATRDAFASSSIAVVSKEPVDPSTPREQGSDATHAAADEIERAARRDAKRSDQDHKLSQMLSIALTCAVNNPGVAPNGAGAAPANGRPGSSNDPARS